MMGSSADWIPVKSQGSSVDFVINSIRNALLNKKLKPGDRLPSENELATTMQVSRSTIREAMKVLSAYGIIDVVHGNGTFICRSDENISMDSILFSFLLSQPSKREQLEFREWMERTVLSLVIQNATQENLDALEANYAELLSVSDDAEASIENDLQFHRLLGNFTGNRLISRIYMFSITYFQASIESTHKNFGSRGAQRVHRLTIDVIRERAYDRVEEVIAENEKTWVGNSDSIFF